MQTRFHFGSCNMNLPTGAHKTELPVWWNEMRLPIGLREKRLPVGQYERKDFVQRCQVASPLDLFISVLC